VLEYDLVALLQAYIGGDMLARKALLDALDEEGDPRGEAVRGEGIDWDGLARKLSTPSPLWPFGKQDVSYMRWLIDCARFGSGSKPRVVEEVREARRLWLRRLFPELEL
jgi:hypothetical protein